MTTAMGMGATKTTSPLDESALHDLRADLDAAHRRIRELEANLDAARYPLNRSLPTTEGSLMGADGVSASGGATAAAEPAERTLKAKVEQLMSRIEHSERDGSEPIAGLEDLGRQFAEAQHRLRAAEEARTALEAEVEELQRRVDATELQASEAPGVRGSLDQPSATVPYAATPERDDTGDAVRGDDGDGDGRDMVTPGMQSFGEDGSAGLPTSSQQRYEETDLPSSVSTTTAAHRQRRGVPPLGRLPSREVDDYDDEIAVEPPTEDSTHTHLTPRPRQSKEEASVGAVTGATGASASAASASGNIGVVVVGEMEDLGRRFAEAQHKLLRSEEARSALETEVEELQRRVQELEQQRASVSTEAPASRRQKGVEEEEDQTTFGEEASMPTAGAPAFTTLVPPSAALRSGSLTSDPTPGEPSTSVEDAATSAATAHTTAASALRGIPAEGDAAVVVDDADLLQAMQERIQELEDRLREMAAEHEEELRELAEKAADRIAENEEELRDLAEKAADRIAEHEEYIQRRLAEQQDRLRPQLDEEEQERRDGGSGLSGAGRDTVFGVAAGGDGSSKQRQQRPIEVSEEAEEEEEMASTDIFGGVPDVSTKVLLDELQVLRDKVATLEAAVDAQSDAHNDALVRQKEEHEADLARQRDEHDAELEAMADELAARLEENDEALRRRLEEQERYYEGLLTQRAPHGKTPPSSSSLPLPGAAAAPSTEAAGSAAGTSAATATAVNEALTESAAATAAAADALAGAEAAVASTAGELARAKEDLIYWQGEHAKLHNRFDQLQEEYESFMQDTEAQRARLSELEERVQQEEARAAHEAASQHIQELRDRLAAMTANVNAMQDDLHARDEALQQTQRELEETKRQLGQDLARATAHAEAKAREVEQLTTHTEELEELLQQGASSVESALAERQQQVDDLAKKLEQAKVAAASAYDQLAQRDALLGQQKEAEEALHRRVVELEANQRELEGQLRAALQGAQDSSRTLAQKEERAAREVERLQRDAQLEQARLRDAHRQETDALRSELDSLRDELQVAQTMVATLPLEGQRYQNQFESLKQQLTEALQHNNQLQADLRETRADLLHQQSLLRSTTGLAEGEEAAALDARVNALLERNEQLDQRLRAVQGERNTLLQENDSLNIQVMNATRVTEVKEQAMRRQENELLHLRSQLSSLKDDLAMRVQMNHAQQQEMEQLREHAAAMTAACEEMQTNALGDAQRAKAHEHAEALLQAKALSVPRLVEEYTSSLLAGYVSMVRALQEDRRRLDERCDTIERTALEALGEGERQTQAYQSALKDAQAEQQQLKEIIEAQAADLKAAEEALAKATEDAKAARAAVSETQRRAHESVFQAQRDLQAADLERADTLNTVELLQEEVQNAARVVEKQKEQYDRKLAEQAADLERALSKAQAHEAALKEAKELAAEERAELRRRLEESNAAREEALQQARALQAQLDRALPRLAQLEEEQAQRNAELMDTAQQLSALSKRTTSEEQVTRKHIDELNHTLQELMQAHSTVQKANNANEALADRLKTQLNLSEQELARVNSHSAQQEAELGAVTRRLAELESLYARDTGDAQARLRDAERRLRGLEQRNDTLQQEQQSLQDRLHQIQGQYEHASDELRQLKDAHQTLSQSSSRQIAAQKERIAATDGELHLLQEAHQQLTLKDAALERELQESQNEAERLQQYLEDANRHNDALNTDLRACKEGHDVEMAEMKETLQGARNELAQCRKTLTEAEARQVELDHGLYGARTEGAKVREELARARGALEEAQQQLHKERVEKQEMATLLQDQVAQLYEEIRAKQMEIKGLENTVAQLQDTITTLRSEVAEGAARLSAVKGEYEAFKEATAASKEQNRRERYDLQSELNAAQDAEAELSKAFEQYKQKMTSKMEMYEVAEESLRREIVDLRADIARLEEALSAVSQGKQHAETHSSRQGHTLKAAEEELQGLRAQASHDMAEISQLKMQLQQRTTELDRAKRDAAAQVVNERNKCEAERRAACDALEGALKKERLITSEARAARERALASLEHKQKDVDRLETEQSELQAQIRDLQREIDLLRHQLQSIQSVATQVAQDVGLYSDRDIHDAEDAARQIDVHDVFDQLLDRLQMFVFAANTLEMEDTQVMELRRAVDREQDTMQMVLDIAAGFSPTGPAITMPGYGMTPPRTQAPRAPSPVSNAYYNARTPTGLETTPRRPPRESGSTAAASSPPLLTFSQQQVLEQISQSSATVAHRLEDHFHSIQQVLRSLVLAMGSDREAVARLTPNAVRQKMQVAATTSALHRRVAGLTNSLLHLADVLTAYQQQQQQPEHGVSQASPMEGRSKSPIPLPTGVSASPLAADEEGVVTSALQATLRAFLDAEQYVLSPYNELLTDDVTPPTAGAASPATVVSSPVAPSSAAGPRGGASAAPSAANLMTPLRRSSASGSWASMTSARTGPILSAAPTTAAAAATASSATGPSPLASSAARSAGGAGTVSTSTSPANTVAAPGAPARHGTRTGLSQPAPTSTGTGTRAPPGMSSAPAGRPAAPSQDGANSSWF